MAGESAVLDILLSQLNVLYLVCSSLQTKKTRWYQKQVGKGIFLMQQNH